MGKQINITIKDGWREQLEELARHQSVKEKQTISYLDLIRRSVEKTYNLKSDS